MLSDKKIPNRLANEKSPYLLQHAYNPVDWWPWCEEVFEMAEAEQRPVFLSIGYSTCHWCHVMERESFEDEEVALLLNRAFLCVKVDREERPDIDAVYMSACTAMTGSGGWPLTVLMTPAQEPFFAGTYLPKEPRYGTVGLLELLHEVERLWRTDRQKLLHAGAQFSQHLMQQSARLAKPGEPSRELYLKGRAQFLRALDRENGGFGGAPKFPMGHNLLFLTELSALEKDDTALSMAEAALCGMYRGGIFDHIGGGFSRYSTDARWLVPHFEKMLYDNALLSLAYTEAYRITGKPLYASVAQRTLNFCLRELLHRDGGFYSAQDADSEGEEGKYYLFTRAEALALLGRERGESFCEAYDLTDGGNFEGKCIPNLLKNDAFTTAAERFSGELNALYAYRQTRMHLSTDDKILTSWNSLMLAALARAGLVFAEARYLDAAVRLRQFLAKRLSDGSERLYGRWRDGHTAFHGVLEDYAFYALGLTALYESTFDVSLLRDAISFARSLHRLFFDTENGGYFLYSAESEKLITRPKETFDGALPSGNSAAALLFLKLYKLTGQREFESLLSTQLRFLAGEAAEAPMGHSLALLAMLDALSPSTELLCVSADGSASESVRVLLSQKSAVNLTALIKTGGNEGVLGRLAPFTLAYPVQTGPAQYYLCRGGSCRKPVSSLEEALELLGTQRLL